jgi:hypothetical protein
MITGIESMYKPITALAALVFSLSIAPTGLAQDNEKSPEEEMVRDDNMRECIQVRRIRRAEVLDDKTVAFRMQGSPVYLNILAKECPGLARENRFTYRTTVSALCRMDSIAVLFDDASGGMRTGPGCNLGPFHLISRDDLKALKEAMKEIPKQDANLPMPAPGEVDAEDNDDVPR